VERRVPEAIEAAALRSCVCDDDIIEAAERSFGNGLDGLGGCWVALRRNGSPAG